MKTVPRNVHVVTQDQAAQLADLPEEISLTLADIAIVAREGLLAMSVAAGMAMMQTMFEAEIAAVAGPKGKHNPERAAVRHGTGKGSVTLGGRRVEVTRPRARTLEGHEVPLQAYRSSPPMTCSGRSYSSGCSPGSRPAGTPGSPNLWAKRSGGRDLDGPVGGVAPVHQGDRDRAGRAAGPRSDRGEDQGPHAGRGAHGRPVVIVALAITADGRKLLVGLWDGATENKTVVRSMLADLVSRGLSADEGLLVGMDGAKALSAAVNEVFGGLAAVQRCTLHKRRNVGDHLPDKEKAWVDAKLVKAFHHPDPDLGLRNAKHLAGLLDKTHPGAANSLREGLEEMFTVSRLGIDGRLAKTLVTSNPIESMISIAGTTNRNVTRWRDGHMVLRWTAAGMLNAERSFRRIKGYKQMPQLVEALHRDAHPETASRTETVGAAA